MMDQAGRRRQVLLAWAFVQRNRGEAVPTNEDLSQIATARGVPPGLRTPLVHRWAHVLHHLMWLSDQGHPDPVKDAVRMAPAGPPIPAPGMPPYGSPARGGPSQGVPAFPARHVPPPPSAGESLQSQPTAPDPQGQASPTGPQGQASPTGPQGQAGAPGPQGQLDSAETEPTGAAASAVPPPASRSRESRQQVSRPREFELPAWQSSASQPPASPPPMPQPVPAEDPLQRLMMWRDRMGHEDLKDRHLRQIVNSGAQNPGEVGAGLPASLKSLAWPIAEQLGLTGPSTAQGSAAEAASPTAPAVTPPRPPSAPPGQGSAGGSPEAPDRNPPAGPMPGQGAPADGFAAHAAHAQPPAPPHASGRLNPRAITWQQPAELADERSRFAPLDFSRSIGEPVAIRTTARADGSVVLRWPVPVERRPVTIYRVVSDDEHVPFSPDMSEIIAVTGESSLIDARPFVSAVRHYQVWANEGESVEDALLEQPRLHAKVPVVAKPVEVDIREDEGRVIGQWTALGDVRRVQIYRVPVERAGAGPGNPSYRICADEPNLGGFVDDGAEPGRRYLYQLLVEAEVEGVPRLSLPAVVPITTTAVLHPVADLACALGDDEQPRFDLTWTAPAAGRVVVYRTSGGPLAGADADTVEEAALPQMRLRLEDRLAHPIVVDGHECRMRDVPWPRGWSRTYFTPVTLIDGKARVGKTTSQVRTGAVTDARVVERVTQQVLTMGWPDGAAAVKVYASPPGQPPAEAIEGAEAIAEISEEMYIRLGGLHFPRPLDANGCDLHLLPISFAGGRAVFGKPATVRYKGLFALWYAVEVRRGMRGRGPVQLTIKVRGDRGYSHSPPFALIHNEQRLPLDVNDGESLMVRAPDDSWWHRFNAVPLRQEWSDPGWIAEVTGRTGWIRLFIDLPPDADRGTVALLDPPVAQLYLGGR